VHLWYSSSDKFQFPRFSICVEQLPTPIWNDMNERSLVGFLNLHLHAELKLPHPNSTTAWILGQGSSLSPISPALSLL